MSNQEQNRLIILGAGASVECGFYPTGAQLIELAKKVGKILENEKVLQEFYGDSQYEMHKASFNYSKNFLNNLVRTNHSSIDTHIALIDNENEQKFLKSFLFSAILASTAYSDFIDNFDNNWYPELSKLIFPVLSSEDNDESKIEAIREKLKFIQIITFNYDVSLEIYLLERSKQYFRNVQKCFEAFDLICEKIFHVYGQILNKEEIKQIIKSYNEEGIIRIDDWKKTFANKLCDLNLVSNAMQNFQINIDGKEININQGNKVKISREDFKKYQGYEGLKSENISYEEFLKDYKNNFYKNFSQIIEKNETQSDVFCLMVIKNTLFFYHNYPNDIKNKTLFSPNRFDVINEQDRKLSEIKSEINKRNFNKSPDSIWVIGFGFDITNTYKILELSDVKWNRSCFATNFGGTLKIKREIYKNLSYYKQKDAKDHFVWKIPNKISEKACSIKKFLNDEYHFLDDVETKYKNLEEGITPWYDM